MTRLVGGDGGGGNRALDALAEDNAAEEVEVDGVCSGAPRETVDDEEDDRGVVEARVAQGLELVVAVVAGVGAAGVTPLGGMPIFVRPVCGTTVLSCAAPASSGALSVSTTSKVS
jgi:hypothetical protein